MIITIDFFCRSSARASSIVLLNDAYWKSYRWGAWKMSPWDLVIIYIVAQEMCETVTFIVLLPLRIHIWHFIFSSCFRYHIINYFIELYGEKG